jgi:hypothetical protein
MVSDAPPKNSPDPPDPIPHDDPPLPVHDKTPPPDPIFRFKSLSTPQRLKRLHNLGSLSGKLSDIREDVILDTGPIPVVSFQDFVDCILPSVDEDLIHSIVERCRHNALVLPSGHWKYFPENPSSVKTHETVTFTPLLSLWNDIITVAEDIKGESATVRMAQRPNQSQASERPTDTRPDGVIELIETTTVTNTVHTKMGRAPWEDTIGPMELKKGDAPHLVSEVCSSRQPIHSQLILCTQNSTKLLFNCTHVLRNDPCRRFCFGITVEDSSMRIWHCSRGGVMVTEHINWIKVRWSVPFQYPETTY